MEADIFVEVTSTVSEEDSGDIIGREQLLQLAIVSEGSHDSAIKKAFKNVFGENVAFSSIHAHSFLDLIPVIPIGYIAALNSAETKIAYVREHALSRQNDIVMSTSSFLLQAVPQRWQLTTILYLYDPKLDLSLHNFTVTTPIPNTYVSVAERKTPLNYIHRECGLGISIEEAISDVTDLGSKSIQEFLSGYNHNRAIKSAAFILASMYKKYVKR